MALMIFFLNFFCQIGICREVFIERLLAKFLFQLVSSEIIEKAEEWAKALIDDDDMDEWDNSLVHEFFDGIVLLHCFC